MPTRPGALDSRVVLRCSPQAPTELQSQCSGCIGALTQNPQVQAAGAGAAALLCPLQAPHKLCAPAAFAVSPLLFSEESPTQRVAREGRRGGRHQGLAKARTRQRQGSVSLPEYLPIPTLKNAKCGGATIICASYEYCNQSYLKPDHISIVRFMKLWGKAWLFIRLCDRKPTSTTNVDTTRIWGALAVQRIHLPIYLRPACPNAVTYSLHNWGTLLNYW